MLLNYLALRTGKRVVIIEKARIPRAVADGVLRASRTDLASVHEQGLACVVASLLRFLDITCKGTSQGMCMHAAWSPQQQ